MTDKPILYVNNNDFTEVLLGYIFKQEGFTIKKYKEDILINIDENNILINNFEYNKFTKDIKTKIKIIEQNKNNILFLIGYDYFNKNITKHEKMIYIINNYIKIGTKILNSFENLFNECLLPINDIIMYYNLEFMNKLADKVNNSKKSKYNNYFKLLFSEKKYENIVNLLVAYTNKLDFDKLRLIAVYNNDNNISLKPYKNTNIDIIGEICGRGGDDIYVDKFDKFIEVYKMLN